VELTTDIFAPLLLFQKDIFFFRELVYITAFLALVHNTVGRRVARIFVRGRHNDGGTEGPERGAEAQSAGAPREWGLGRGAVAPPQYGGLGLCPQKIFEKSTLKLHIFVWF